MEYMIAYGIAFVVVGAIINGVNGLFRSDFTEDGEYKDFDWLCNNSSLIILTSFAFECHARNENDDEVVVPSFVDAIQNAAKYGFVTTSQSDSMITLSKKQIN
jgi:hypothetical protein